MKKGLRLVSVVAVLLGTVGCASSGESRMESIFRSDLGRQLSAHVADVQFKIWNKHSIPLYRKEESFRDIMYESQWMPRTPTAAEATLGVTDARNRIILRAHRLEAEMDVYGEGVYRTTFEIQNQVRSVESEDWHPAAIPDEAVDMYRPVLSDMELELKTGLRRR